MFSTQVSTSCFEHDPIFWLTFKEIARVTKVDGFVYVNAPSNEVYHGYPGDNWRFYKDAPAAQRPAAAPRRQSDLCGKQPLVRVGPSNLETRLARSKRGLFGSFLDRCSSLLEISRSG